MKANRPASFETQLAFDEFCRCIRNLKVGDVVHLTQHNRSFQVVEIHGRDSMLYDTPRFWVDELPSRDGYSLGLKRYWWSIRDCSPIDRIVKATQ